MSVSQDKVAGEFFFVKNYKATFDIDDGTDGEGGENSAFSYTGQYDRQGHGINVQIANPPAGTTIKYSRGSSGTAPTGGWSMVNPLFTNVCDKTVVWYAVECAGYVSYTNNATVTLTPKPIAVTAEAKTQVYGTAAKPLTYTVDGLIAGDALTGALTREPGNGVGEYDILQGTLANGNYAISYTGAKYTITKGTIPGGGEEPGEGSIPEGGLSKFDATYMYDGVGHAIKTNELVAAYRAALVGEFAVQYAVGGSGGQGLPALPPTDAGAWGIVAPVHTNVGEYVVWYKVTSANYEDFVHQAKVAITPRPLAVKAEAKTQVYGAAAKPLTYTTVGLIAGDALTGALTREPGEGVGEYDILQGTLANGNYAISYTGAKYTITRGTISGGGEEPGTGTIPEGGLSKFDATYMYDGEGHTIKTNELVAAYRAALVGEFAVQYAVGGSGGQGLPALPPTDAGAWRTVAPVYTNVGEYVVWYKVTSANYEDFVHPAKVTITEAYKPLVIRCEWMDGAVAPASQSFKIMANGVELQTVTVTAAEGWKKSVDVKVYDGGQVIVYAVEPVQTSGVRSEVESYGCKLFGSCKTVDLVLTRNGWQSFGTIVPSKEIYTIDGWWQMGDVRPSVMSVSQDKVAGEFFLVKNYKATFDIDDGTDGEGGENSAFSYSGVYDGQGHGIAVRIDNPPAGTTIKYSRGGSGTAPTSGWSTVNPLFTNVCDKAVVWYAVECAGYVSYTNNATVTITPKPIAVTADAKEKVFGTADPALTYVVSGLLGTDVLTGALVRAPGEAVGTYDILQGTLATGPNYTIDFTGATFTIDQTPIIGPFGPAEPDIDPETGLVIIRLLDDQGPIVIPDNLGPFILDINGHSVTGVCGSAESGTYDGGPAIVFTHVEYGEGTSVIVRNSDPQGRGGIFGGDGADGTAEHPAGGDGGPGILIEDAAVAPSVTIEENVLVRGGRGGNGYAGSGADGGDGGAGIEDQTTEPDDSTIVNGGTIEGGDGGSGADGTGDTPGGNGGDGGAGVDGDVDDNTGTITGGDGGDGGDSESGDGGNGGDGGDGVGGDVGDNSGDITGGNGGDGGSSGSGDGGDGGNGGSGVGGDVGDNTGTITDGEDGTTVLTASMVSLDGEPWIYMGTPIEPTVTVTSGGSVLAKGEDYTVAYQNNVYVGTATVVITGLGTCEGTVTKTFAILPKEITDEMVQPGEDAFFFDGDAKKPTVDVQYLVGGKDICSESDYMLEYGVKADAGWWVTVMGQGNYTGEVTKIVPVLKRPVAPPVVPTKAYTGKTQKPTIPTDSRWMVVANPGGIEVGDYTNVVLRLTDTVNYKWKGGTEDQTDITLVFSVTRANNGWSRQPDMKGWEYGTTPSEPSMGQARYGTVQVAYRKDGADVSTETATRPELPGAYIARFYVEATDNYIGFSRDVAFEITGTVPDDPEKPELPESVMALISMAADGTPVISWTPDLSDDPRIVYTVLGKANLLDKDWTPVTDANRAMMRFFKVRVEVK